MKIGYARVSTSDQNLDLQSRALTEYGCTTIYQEKISGKNTDRPELKKLLKNLEKGDQVSCLEIGSPWPLAKRLGWTWLQFSMKRK